MTSTHQRADIKPPAADERENTNLHDNQQFDFDHHIAQAYDSPESETIEQHTSKHFSDGKSQFSNRCGRFTVKQRGQR